MITRPSSTLPPGTITADAPPAVRLAAPIQAVYNPTPPVKPVVKKASGAGCLSLLVMMLGPVAVAAILLAVSR
jgi:hypothetical protein